MKKRETRRPAATATASDAAASSRHDVFAKFAKSWRAVRRGGQVLRQPLAIAAMVAASAVFVAFSPLLRASFLYDDQSVILCDEAVLEAVEPQDVAVFANLWKKPRPLRQLTHRVDWRLFGDNPAPHHAANIMLHLAVGLLWWRILRKRLGLSGKVAGLATALFLLNPVTVESLGIVSHRKEMLGALFALLGLDAAVKALPSVSAAALVSFAVAAAGKETSLVAPFMVPLLALFREWSDKGKSEFAGKSGGAEMRRAYFAYAVLAIAIGALAWWQIQAGMAYAGGNPGEHEARAGHFTAGAPWTAACSAALRALPRYMAMAAWPAGHAPDPAISLETPLLSFETALSLLAVALAAAIVIRLLRRRDQVGLAAAWFALALAPCVFPAMLRSGATALLADRYLYFPSLGFALAVALLAWRLPTRIALAVSMALCAGAGAATFLACRHYRDPVEYWGHATRVNGASSIAAHNHALALWKERGDFAGAEREFRRMLSLAPDFDYGICTFAQMHVEENDPVTAADLLDSAIAKRPRSVALRRERALVAAIRGEPHARTLALFKAAAGLGADDAAFHYGYGTALRDALDWPAAARELSLAGSRSPGFADEAREAAFLASDPPARPGGAILVLGDSVPHGTGTATEEGGAELSLADALARSRLPFGASKAIDLSVPGSRALAAAGQLGKYTSSAGQATPPPTCCIIWSGHNDAFVGEKSFDILSSLADAAFACRKAGAVPVVVGPIHVRSDAERERTGQERTLEALDRKLESFCRRSSIRYVSSRKALGPNPGDRGLYDAATGNHLSGGGIERLSVAIADICARR